MIAALYVERGGPYFGRDDVDPWDIERDARKYDGPHPVVAHPPCGPWGSLRSFYKGNEHDIAPLAVEQVRMFGGVLEHPARSLLWKYCRLPLPGEFADVHGGWSLEVNQVHWGHKCVKPTWLYLVGVRRFTPSPPMPDARPTHGIWYGDFERDAHRAGQRLLGASKEIRRRTPPLFADWLVALAHASAHRRAA